MAILFRIGAGAAGIAARRAGGDALNDCGIAKAGEGNEDGPVFYAVASSLRAIASEHVLFGRKAGRDQIFDPGQVCR